MRSRELLQIAHSKNTILPQSMASLLGASATANTANEILNLAIKFLGVKLEGVFTAEFLMCPSDGCNALYASGFGIQDTPLYASDLRKSRVCIRPNSTRFFYLVEELFCRKSSYAENTWKRNSCRPARLLV